MAKDHNDNCICPLFQRQIQYGECYEVQEIRNDDMSMELALEAFDVSKADVECKKCRFYVIS